MYTTTLILEKSARFRPNKALIVYPDGTLQVMPQAHTLLPSTDDHCAHIYIIGAQKILKTDTHVIRDGRVEKIVSNDEYSTPSNRVIMCTTWDAIKTFPQAYTRIIATTNPYINHLRIDYEYLNRFISSNGVEELISDENLINYIC